MSVPSFELSWVSSLVLGAYDLSFCYGYSLVGNEKRNSTSKIWNHWGV